MAWYLVLLSLALTVMLLDRLRLTWLVFTVATVASVVGSFSSLQGLLIWPAGLVLLYHRRRSRSFVTVWIAAGIATTFLYFYHFNFDSTPEHGLALDHPVLAVKFYLFAVGDIVGFQVGHSNLADDAVIAFGLVIFLLATSALLKFGVHRDESGGSPVGIAFICVGLLFAATVTEGTDIFRTTWCSGIAVYHF
jgi:hypothetical protein